LFNNIHLKTTTEAGDAATFIAEAIIHHLDSGKRILWFVTGGSAIAVATKAAKILFKWQQKHSYRNLVIMLTDERYGPLNHPDSNWFQLKKSGFSLSGAKLVPILTGDSRTNTTRKFNIALEEELSKAEYKIGLFGVGADGHTAGILPKSEAMNNASELSVAYDTEKFERITVTPKTIAKLDEAVAFIQGEEKWKIVEDLMKKNLNIFEQPAQILKRVPLLTIFTDYKIK